jgi:HAE1 family hydrophobic/amphiphilic exporter-1
VDFTNKRRALGVDRRSALIDAGEIRLRPIVMTTLAMIFGMLPLALALGAGAEFRAPMARAVVGGLITSSLLTLIVIPVVYTFFDDLGSAAVRRFTRAERARKRAGPEAAAEQASESAPESEPAPALPPR